ncbi:MAG: homoserine dehydrogenase, partial [Myxococcota bacterium]
MSGGRIRLGVLGLGTVGSAVAEILHRDRVRLSERVGAELQLVRAVVRNRKRKLTRATKKIELVTHPAAVLEADDIDVVVELAGGIDPAKSWI